MLGIGGPDRLLMLWHMGIEKVIERTHLLGHTPASSEVLYESQQGKLMEQGEPLRKPWIFDPVGITPNTTPAGASGIGPEESAALPLLVNSA